MSKRSCAVRMPLYTMPRGTDVLLKELRRGCGRVRSTLGASRQKPDRLRSDLQHDSERAGNRFVGADNRDVQSRDDVGDGNAQDRDRLTRFSLEVIRADEASTA